MPVDIDLKKLILGGHCIAFVGAGLSVPPADTWKNTVKQIAEECNVQNDPANPLQVIDNCIDADPQKYIEVLRRCWPTNTATSRTALHQLLRLKLKAILTTNFDSWLRQNARFGDFSECYTYPMLPLHCDLSSKLIYLHGCFDSDVVTVNAPPLVFGERSFQEAYGQSLLPGFLTSIFVTQSVLFVAFNPTEPHVARLLRESITIRKNILSVSGSDRTKRYILVETPPTNSRKMRDEYDLWISSVRALDIIPVPYDPEAPDHRGLERVFTGWIDEGEMRNRMPPFATGF